MHLPHDVLTLQWQDRAAASEEKTHSHGPPLSRTGDHQSAKFVALDPLPSGYDQRDPKHQSAKCVALDSLPSGFDQRDPKKPKKTKKTKKTTL